MNTTKLRFVEGGEKTLAERKSSLRAYMKRRRADNANRDVKEVLLCQNLFSVLEDFEKRTGQVRDETFSFTFPFPRKHRRTSWWKPCKNRGFACMRQG